MHILEDKRKKAELSIHSKNLEREQQNKHKYKRRKDIIKITKINEIENKHTI